MSYLCSCVLPRFPRKYAFKLAVWLKSVLFNLLCVFDPSSLIFLSFCFFSSHIGVLSFLPISFHLPSLSFILLQTLQCSCTHIFLILWLYPPPLGEVVVLYWNLLYCPSFCIQFCPVYTSWTVQPFLTKFGMVVHEMEYGAEKLVHVLQVKVTVRAYDHFYYIF